MTSPQQSSLAFLQALLQQWGLESLSSTVGDMLTSGDSPDVIPIKLRETEPYKKRFKANLDRVKNGLPAQSEAEFLTTEAALKDVVRRYVGSGTYDTREYTDKWITKDVSAQELNNRMQEWQSDVQRRMNTKVMLDDGREITVGEAWAFHGLTPADALAATFDPNVNETTLQRKLRSYSLGAEALGAYRDTNVLDQERLGQLADAGLSPEDARRGFNEVAARQDFESQLAHQAGTELTRAEQENAALLGDATAEQKRRKVLGQAQAQFDQNYLGGINTLRRSGTAAQNY